MNSKEETLNQIHKYHKNVTGSKGIKGCYEELRKLVYFPHFKLIVQKNINNCDVCNKAKYGRKPFEPKFEITET